jgi:ribonuclease P protein component
MYLYARPGPTRVGLIVVQSPRSAVTRNRVRRRLRAVARQAVPAAGWEVVLRAGGGAATTDFQEMVRNVKRGLSKAGA